MDIEKQSLLYRLLGENIRMFRTMSQLTQEQLATKVGLSRASMVNIEKGRQHPSLHLLIEITEHLGTSLHNLVPNQTIDVLDSVLDRMEIEELPPKSVIRLESFIQSHHNLEKS